MSKNLRYSRILLKRTEIPNLSATTAPATEDHTLQPAWSTTDIYKGEFFLNLQDDRLYIRTTNGIREVPLSIPSDREYGDLIVFDGTNWVNMAYIPTTGVTGGTSGTNGSSGTDGTSGSSGTDGTSGSSGSSGISPSGSTGVDYLSGLTDVTITSLINGEILRYSGGTWINSNENSIQNLSWSKDTQTFTIEDLYGSHNLKIEGRPIDIISGNTILTDDFYTCLCHTGLTITLPPTSGWTIGDSYHGSMFVFKLIQTGPGGVSNVSGVTSGSTTKIQIDTSDTGILIDESYDYPASDILDNYVNLTVFGETFTLQANSDDKTWYMIEHSYPKYFLKYLGDI